MSKSIAVRRVARYLEHHIRSLGPNKALPSFRTVMKDCRVGPATVQQVVRDLQQRRLIVVRPQRGVFTAEQLSAAQLDEIRISHIDVIYIDADDAVSPSGPFRQDLRRHLLVEPHQRGYEVRIHDVDGRPPLVLDQVRHLAAHEECQACIVVHLAELAQLDPLREARVPFVCLYPESPTCPPNSVLVNVDEVIASQIRHLVGLGHRRIGYLHNAEPDAFHRGHMLRRETFYRMALDLHLPVTSAMVQFAGYRAETQRTAARALLDHDPRPTAVICVDGHLAELYRAAAERGLLIGRDLSVVGTNNNPDAERVSPAATTVEIPREQAVRVAMDLLADVVRAPEAQLPSRFVPTPFVNRRSTGPAPDQPDASLPGRL